MEHYLKFALVCLVNISATHWSIAQAQSTWNPSRNGQNQVAEQGFVFDYELSGQEILSGFAVGHNIPRSENHLFYNLKLDGYGGLPFGSCLRRGYLLSDADPTKTICEANENKDLMRVWGNRNPDLKNVLLKNMTVMNAFRTYNVVDGTVVTSSRELPHTDTFQTFYSGSAAENADWLVIQDSVMRNSDNNLMISGSGRFSGVLYQNLSTGCDAEFVQDARQRSVNDSIEFTGNANPRSSSCNNSMRVGTAGRAVVWLVNVSPGNNGDARVDVINGLGRVVVVGNPQGQFGIFTRDANRKRIRHPNVRYYDSIESALASEGSASKPPFIELSCSGWQTQPGGCESRSGFLNDGSPPVNTDGDGGSTGDADGSDRPSDDNDNSGNDGVATNASPIYHWRLDDRVGSLTRDSAGNANGQLSGFSGSPWVTNGAKLGASALLFNGGAEKVDLSNIDMQGNQMSMMGWIRVSDIDAANREGRILSKASGSSSGQHYWMLSLDENGSGVIVPRARLKVGANTVTLLGANDSEVVENKWVHIAATYNGSRLRLYFNGEETSQVNASGNIGQSSNVAVAIGNQPQGNRGFVGLIDDVCLFNEAISAGEVRRLFNGGTGLACDSLKQGVLVNPIPGVNDNNAIVVPPIMLLLSEDRDR